MRIQIHRLVMVLGLWAGCASAPSVAGTQADGGGRAVARLINEAAAARSQSQSPWSTQFMTSIPTLPRIATRRLSFSPDGSRYYAERELKALPSDARAHFQTEVVDETGYYYGPLGSPLFYVRLLDLVAENLRAHLQGRRILEWNYTSIGPLKLLAAQGVQAVGVSPSPRLRALYSYPGDQGDVKMVDRDISGRVTLVVGNFPVDSTATVGGQYDVIIARNVLTHALVRPGATSTAAPTEAASSDETFLRALFATLRPGGRLLAYNLCPPPPPADKPYDPSRDCRNPFPQALWQAMGFRVHDYDRSDTTAARALATALEPGPAPAHLRPDETFATYTLVERP